MKDWNDYGNEYVHGLEAEIDKLNAELAALRQQLANLEGLRIGDEIYLAQQKADALRPLAAIGERALRDGWYMSSPDKAGDFYCYECRQMYDKHYSNCPIPALLAQLEAEG